MAFVRSVEAAAVCAAVAMCSLVPAYARADTRPDHDAALVEFREARKKIDAGDCLGAIPHLERSLAHEPSIGARLSVAECLEKTEPLRAWRALADAAVLAYTAHDDRLELTETRAVQLERALPTLRIVLSPADLLLPGLEVRVDGQPIDRFHLRRGVVAVEPGEHTVDVRAPDRAPWSRRIAAPAPGSTTQLAVELADRPPETTEATPARVVVRDDPRTPRRAAGFALVATGAVGLGVGTVFGIMAIVRAGELDDACGGRRDACGGLTPTVTSLQESATTTASVSTVSFIAGGVVLAAGAALLLWPASAPARTPSTSAVRVTAHGLEGTF